ncbi:hypothetical protein [Virgisporangium ochraceum]|uniref:hypothetical protein n=1 Tax=Virgisporangium ochraceum TaxID=65505 RepID=UPI001942EF06|nr:hypothetical protein [Virgisporangium ochraceum]
MIAEIERDKSVLGYVGCQLCEPIPGQKLGPPDDLTVRKEDYNPDTPGEFGLAALRHFELLENAHGVFIRTVTHPDAIDHPAVRLLANCGRFDNTFVG